jgi:hypothetical protein
MPPWGDSNTDASIAITTARNPTPAEMAQCGCVAAKS